MNIFLNAYINKNLGDDLFIKIISNRYPGVNFYTNKDASYLKLKNVHYDNTCNIHNKIFNLLTFGNFTSDEKMSKKNDLSVILGGSMFIEKNSIIKSIYNVITDRVKYNYVIGANFGPYRNKFYFKHYYKKFKQCDDICFRDKKTFNSFSKIHNVRYAPDVVFTLNKKDYNIKNNKEVVISIINVEDRFNKDITNTYLENIINIIKYYQEKNYKICLMSFCNYEKDDIAIENIIKRLDNKKNISSYHYYGNLNEALNIIASSSIIVGSRFHANILGFKFGKKVIPFCYSDKTINMLKDLKFNGLYNDIRKGNKINVKMLDNLVNNYVDCSKLEKEAEKQFMELDKMIEG